MDNKIQTFLNSELMTNLRKRCLLEERLVLEESHTSDTIKITISKIVNGTSIAQSLEMRDTALDLANEEINRMFKTFYDREQHVKSNLS